MKPELTKEQKRWISAQLSKEERKAIIRVSYGGQKDLQFYIAEEKINNLINQLMASHPKSIPADKFRPMFDTSTNDGKIAVYSRWLKTGEKPWVKYKTDPNDDWDQSDPGWMWSHYDYNFPTEPKRTLVPWTKDTVPREAWVREKTERFNELRIVAITHNFIGFASPCTCKNGMSLSYPLLCSEYEHSLDGGKTWLPCGTWKEEV